MKLQLNTADGTNTISAHSAGVVVINQVRHTQPLIVMPQQLVSPWPVADLDQLAPSDFDAVLALAPELVIFGSGASFRFPDPRIMTLFSRARIGFDVMDTPAACRTFNVLVSEGRNPAAALLV